MAEPVEEDVWLPVVVETATEVAEEELGVASSLQSLAAFCTSVP